MTILFSNSNPKIPKSGIFDPKFKDFYFCTKLDVKTNFRTLASNMTKIFSNSSPKIWKSGTFGPRFKNFYFLHQTLQKNKFKDADCKCENVFSAYLPKDPNRAFLISSLIFFVLDESL